MGLIELVCFLAACMAVNALTVDVMIPALPAMGDDLGVTDPNHRQAVIVAYLIGMGVSQLFYGPASDRFGRRPTLLAGLALFTAAALAAVFAPTFPLLIAARVVQGLGAGAPRVVAVSVARDRHRGPELARVMSLVMMVFMVVPIAAPSVGQLILLVAPWRWIFAVLFVAGLALAAWTATRLDETLRPEHRRELSLASVARGYALVARTRATVVPMVAMGLVMGALMTFITAAQQVFQDVYGVGRAFTLLFATIAATMSVGAFLNSRAVLSVGPHRMASRGMYGFIATSVVFVVLAWLDRLDLVGFVVLQSITLFAFAFVGANLNAIAMEPMAKVAGTASSAIGAFTTVVAAVVGGTIANQFDGTVRPLAAGNLGLGVAALLVMQLGRGRDEVAAPV